MRLIRGFCEEECTLCFCAYKEGTYHPFDEEKRFCYLKNKDIILKPDFQSLMEAIIKNEKDNI